MSLDKQQIRLVFDGLDSHSDPKTVDASKLLKLENAVVTKPNEIRKRTGFAALSSTIRGTVAGTIADIKQMTKREEIPTALGGWTAATSGACQYSQSALAWDVVPSQLNGPAAVKELGLQIPTGMAQAFVEVAVAYSTVADYTADGTKALVCVSNASEGHYCLLDRVTGEQRWTTVAASRLHCVAVGRYLVLLMAGGGSIEARVFDATTSMDTYTDVALANNWDSPAYDVCVEWTKTAAPSVLLAYRRIVGADITLGLVEFDPALRIVTNSNAIDVADGHEPEDLAWMDTASAGIADLALAIFHVGVGVVYMRVDSALQWVSSQVADASVTWSGRLLELCGYEQGGKSVILWSGLVGAPGATTYRSYSTRHVTFTPGAAATVTEHYGLYLRSKPRLVSGSTWVFWASEAILSGTGYNDQQLNTSDYALTVTATAINRAPHAMACVGSSQGAVLGRWLPAIDSDGTDLYHGTARVTTAAELGAGLSQTVAPVLIRTITGSIPGNCSEYDRTTYLPGGTLRLIDGGHYRGQPFAQFPWPLHAGHSNVAGNGLTGGATYRYCAVFRWVDAHGNVWRSAPSDVLDVTLDAADNTVTAYVSTLQIGDYVTDVDIELYRADGGSDVFQLVSITSNTTADYLSIVDDGLGDPGEVLYTVSGELESHCPPPSVASAVFQGRLWLASGNTLWFSKEMRAGFGPQFNGNLTITIPGEDITALAVMDDKLVIFKAHGIWALAGDGPNNLGQGAYPTPQLVAPAHGTTNPRTVAVTPDGAMFYHASNPWILTRGLGVEFVGAPVDGLLASPVDAIVVPEKGQVRFYGVLSCLVYDWVHKLWSQWTSASWSAGATSVGGLAYVATWTGGTVCVDTATYYDGLATIVTRVTLANLSLAGIRGAQRIYRVQLLGEWSGTAQPVTQTLTAKCYYDQSTVAGETHTFVPTAALQSIELRPSRQKCSSMSIELYDAPVTGTAAFKLSAVMLEVGAKRGVGRLASATRFT